MLVYIILEMLDRYNYLVFSAHIDVDAAANYCQTKGAESSLVLTVHNTKTQEAIWVAHKSPKSSEWIVYPEIRREVHKHREVMEAFKIEP